ncbi:MAG: ClbS/DfsB family four-helix bundle protein [Pseudomonadota bacterium]
MAATNQAELKAIIEKEYAKLTKLLDTVDPDFAMEKDKDDTSIKDVIGHRAHWIDLFLGWYTDGMAGKEVHFPAKGYKWNQLKPYNAMIREQQKDMGWEQAKAMLADRHERLMDFINHGDDETLYGGPMKGANNAWTPGRWAEASGPSHYRSAAKYIRARLREH